MNDFQPIKYATPKERQYVCPKNFWIKSHICRACGNFESDIDNEKAYCSCGYK